MFADGVGSSGTTTANGLTSFNISSFRLFDFFLLVFLHSLLSLLLPQPFVCSILVLLQFELPQPLISLVPL
jgi:hypothetical protein